MNTALMIKLGAVALVLLAAFVGGFRQGYLHVERDWDKAKAKATAAQLEAEREQVQFNRDAARARAAAASIANKDARSRAERVNRATSQEPAASAVCAVSDGVRDDLAAAIDAANAAR